MVRWATTRTGTLTTSVASPMHKTLVLIKESNKRDINYKPLEENWERVQDFRLEDGSKPEVIALPMPAPVIYKNWRLPASYANFYISNSCVIVPTFNDRTTASRSASWASCSRTVRWWASTRWTWCWASGRSTA
jgi:agmatine/peptidylarginine deiminase